MTDYAICPFYEYEKNGILHCEHGNINFPERSDRNLWMKMHCNSWEHKICKFYTELMRKYNKDTN